MPSPMEPDLSTDPTINGLDDYLEDVEISRIVNAPDDYDKCVGEMACYQITHASTSLIPAGARISFSIKGTMNPESVQTAGEVIVQTQLLDIVEGQYYDIDKGNFASDFETTPGGITLPSGKRLETFKDDGTAEGSGDRTYEEDVIYTIYFVQPDYVPQ